MNKGTRKQYGFYTTLGALVLMYVAALFTGVTITGEQLIQISWIVTILSGAFFGANSIEHIATKGGKNAV